MAIPFAFPSDENTEVNYQRLDQLLSDLFDVLQQILITQRRIRDAQPSQITDRIRMGQSSSRRVLEGTDPPSFPPPEPPRLLSEELRFPPNVIPPAVLPAVSSTITSTNDILRFESSTGGRSPARRRRRRRRTSSECGTEDKPTGLEVATPAQDWTQVGANLRKIADDFYASVGKNESQPADEGKRPCGVEASNTGDAGLLSMLVPPPFCGSIWTAVIFVVGWRLLARAR